MNKSAQLERIRQQLLPEQAEYEQLSGLFDDWYEIACAQANRPAGEQDPALLALVRQMVVAAYRRRGNEGMTANSVGGQSERYEPLEHKLFRSIVRAGLRRFAP
ncbi:MAG: hypothetical protein HFG20_05680 [Anaerotruncus sp.]|nr:hypothetical protein [Anaerotruncus sp.]